MRLGIVGCGNMAQAMLRRWLAAGVVQREAVQGCTARPQSAVQVAAAWGIACSTSVADAVAAADVVLIACKPQQRDPVLAACAAAARGRGPLWISVLAGVDVAQLQQALGPHSRVVRWMPNTPVAVGAGAVAHCEGARVDATDLRLQTALLAPLGLGVALAESQLDAFTAIAGCGPAYVFRFLEALQAAGEALGLDAELARQAAAETVRGAALLLASSGQSAASLRAQVTSKGGMTEAAVQVLDQAGWHDTLGHAVAAAHARAGALAGAASLAPPSPSSQS
jgi:pyrroline-5-carboxylate reductase